MKKKYILVIIVLFLSLMGKVNADMGDLRYDITDLTIRDNKITFKGWAFIHKTQNFVTINKLDQNGNKTNEVLNVPLSNGKTVTGSTTNGGQRIYIIAYYIDDNGREVPIETKDVEGQSDPDYNFYYQMYYSFDTKSKEVKPRVYNGEYNPFTKAKENVNTCAIKSSNDWVQCYYEDISFDITFDVTSSDWQNVSEDVGVYFKIAATNNDYKEKAKVNSNNLNKDITKYESLYIRENLLIGKNSETSYIKVDKRNLSTTVKFIATTAWISDIGFSDLDSSNSRMCIGATNYTYNLVTSGGDKQGFKNGFLASKTNDFPKNTKGPGRLLINTSGNNGGICYPGSSKTMAAWASWVKPSGELSFKINVKNDKKCAVSEPASNKTMNCNEWKSLYSNCENLTVRNNGTSEVVKIEQKGYITNIFKSNLVNEDKNYDANSYNGGWLKYGITYYNEVSWSYNTIKSRSTEAQENINEAMQNKLKKLDKFEENINLTINGLDGSRLVKKCTQSGSFTPANKLITVCTFFLPESYLKELTGNVSYSESNDNANINNKYYIPLDAQKHNISVKLENLSVLSENQAKTDSQKKNSPWFGIWTINTNCSLKVTNRIYEPSGGGKENGKVKYKFIYRPINLSNPFPNRFPGVNWYTWYITEGNKDKKTLEDSYTKLEYYTELDNRTISKIKEYNKINNYFNKVETDFFKDYIKEGGNS